MGDEAFLREASVIFNEDVFNPGIPTVPMPSSPGPGVVFGEEEELPPLPGTPAAAATPPRRRRPDVRRRVTLNPREIAAEVRLPETVALVEEASAGAPVKEHVVITKPESWFQEGVAFYQPRIGKIAPSLLTASATAMQEDMVLRETNYAYAAMVIYSQEESRDKMTMAMIQTGRALTRALMQRYFGTNELEAAYQRLFEQELAAAQAQFIREQIDNDRRDRLLRLEDENAEKLEAKKNQYMQMLAQMMREAQEEIACRKVYDAVGGLDRVTVSQILYSYAGARGVTQPDAVEAQLVLKHLPPSVASQLKELVFDPMLTCNEFDVRKFDADRVRLKTQLEINDAAVALFDEEADEKINEWSEKTFDGIPTRVDEFLEAYAPAVYASLKLIFNDTKRACDRATYVTLNDFLTNKVVSQHYVVKASVLDIAKSTTLDPRLAHTRYALGRQTIGLTQANLNLAQALYEARWRSTPALGAVGDTSY